MSISATYGGVTSYAVMVISISPSTAHDIPYVWVPAGSLGFVGVPFNQPIEVTDAANVTFSTPLPDGLNYAVTNGSGDISGIPTTPGTYAVPFSATNAIGTTTGVMTITIVAPQSTLPIIATQPAGETVIEGQSAVLSIATTGTPSPTFQWMHGTTLLDGATQSTFSLPVTVVTDAGDYTVIVTNPSGSVTSQAAHLAVTPAATPTPPPTSSPTPIPPTPTPTPTSSPTPPPAPSPTPSAGVPVPPPPRTATKTVMNVSGLKVVLTGKGNTSTMVEYRIGYSGRFRIATGISNWKIVAGIHRGTNVIFLRTVDRHTGATSQLKRVVVTTT